MAIVQVRIQGLMVDPYNQAYIVVLRPDEEGSDEELLPIWVGKPEANAIGLALEHVETPRPMTHDLLRDVIETLGARVLSVVVTDLVENTFFAKIHLLHGDGEVTVDARPSDAIALALRTECPVFVESGVLTRNRTGEIEQWLENLKPEDFGNMD
ncbi:MAG: bifunctional nuclease family protein [Nitrospirota bacterium]|nr:bifunctional nuclease family protein [Nitrospirota bacterium]